MDWSGQIKAELERAKAEHVLGAVTVMEQAVADVSVAVVGQLRASEMQSALLDAMRLCESPIEQAFLLGLVYSGCATGLPVFARSHDGPHHYFSYPDLLPASPDYRTDWGAAIGEGTDGRIVIAQQDQFSRMRVDFCVSYVGHLRHRSAPWIPITHRVMVECDGHAYHERTKEQAIHDRRRDRRIQQNGDDVFRFTGSEIWHAPFQRAREVIDYLAQAASSDRGESRYA